MLKLTHPGYHGFFSYCSIALIQILNYFNNNNKLPENIDMSELFTFFKLDETQDISNIFFQKNNDLIKINKTNNINIIDQYDDYHNINFLFYTIIINNYFLLSDEINNIIINIEKKYNINYDNTCCVFYRGNDKITETMLPNYDDVILKIKSVLNFDNNSTYLLQSDETEFFDFFKSILSQYIIFNDEIKHIHRRKTSINHITDYPTRLFLIKNFVAIVKIMSKCKYIFCNAGNISFWITIFRGNHNNLYVFNNGSWL
jgi:hypothetical protein